MHQNSQNLATHLQSILQLKTDQGESAPRNTATSTPGTEYLVDHQIFDYAMAHDLPIVVAIDGSLDETGVAAVSIAIIAPDIKDSDPIGSLNWLSRLAKVLLIRSWRLPKKWGTNYACINMAESIGFILGEYTILAHLPIIYITDSNNARTLQRRVRHINNYTHRQRVWQNKQGIDYSIANHLETTNFQVATRRPTPIQYTQAVHQRGRTMPLLGPFFTPTDQTPSTPPTPKIP
jgi:hypothetical protein